MFAKVVAAVLGLGLIVAVFSFQSRSTKKISGRVVSAETKGPLSDVIVVVQSGMFDGPGSPEPIYVKTDKDGRFAARLYDDNISIRAWKQGYAENGSMGEDRSPSGEVVIELRQMTASNWVPERDEFYDFELWKGFSFASAKPVGASGSEADIVLVESKDDPTKAFIEVGGNGGIVFQLFDGNIDFYNTPEAPQTGYASRVPVEMSRAGLYFLRTRDGNHYAKFRLMLSAGITPQGLKYLDWANARMIWSYQPDGTRNLEIARNPPILSLL